MAAWSIVTTVVFGVLNVAQWVSQYGSSQRLKGRVPQLEGLKASLVQFNAVCNDAENKGDAEKPDAMARFISDTAHMAKAMEHHVDIMLGNLQLVPHKPETLYLRIVGFIFPLSRIK